MHRQQYLGTRASSCLAELGTNIVSLARSNRFYCLPNELQLCSNGCYRNAVFLFCLTTPTLHTRPHANTRCVRLNVPNACLSKTQSAHFDFPDVTWFALFQLLPSAKNKVSLVTRHSNAVVQMLEKRAVQKANKNVSYLIF